MHDVDDAARVLWRRVRQDAVPEVEDEAGLSPHLLQDGTEHEGVRYEAVVEGEIRSEINVVGLTVEEALPVVDKFIDGALLGGLEEVDIIHGLGTGRLREAIGKHLRYHPNVKRFGPKDVMKSEVTVVEFC